MCFHPLHSSIQPPERFTWPFAYEPHELCLQAAAEVRRHVEQSAELLTDARRGKMFGVLVCRAERAASSSRPAVGFLAAFSGLLAGRSRWPFFVPPVFDAQQPDGHFKQTERRISALNSRLSTLAPTSAEADALRSQRHRLSVELQQWLFQQYHMLNARGQSKDLIEIWRSYHTSPSLQLRFPLPPAGSGDCCAPKLLQHAYASGLRPLCMAEFWYGESPRSEVRHHLSFYPACRGKCLPILTWMMQGLDVDPDPLLSTHAPAADASLPTLYEDPHLAIVEKPSGMLSVPGRDPLAPSVQAIMRARVPEARGPMMVHRLDQDTSGLLLVCKTHEAYQHLQRQFLQHTVRKQYVALLQGVSPSLPSKGTVSLPLRPDPLDRPRQLVDLAAGHPAITDYELLAAATQPRPLTRVLLTPHTGRTHQLRMHCAHPSGLGMPILGDRLYGPDPMPSGRLCLHASLLAFRHPATGQELTFTSAPDF